MNTKKSFCSLSGLLIRQDLKKYWHISAASFLALFCLIGIPLLKLQGRKYIFDIVLFSSDYEDLYGLLQALILAAPAVFAAVCVFSYLHVRESAAASFELPFSRKTMFQSHALSGWILAAAPVIITGILLTLVFTLKSIFGGLILYADNPEVTAYPEIVSLMTDWVLTAFATVTFTYCLSVLAAVISGTVFTHILLSLFLNGAAPVLVYLINAYLMRFLKGLSYPPVASYSLSPFSKFYFGGLYSNDRMAYTLFLAFSLAVLLLAGLLYRKIKAEREGEAVVFRSVGEIVCGLFAFIGMSLFAFISETLTGESSTVMFLLLGFIGSLLFYAIARMVLDKGLRIFHKKALRGYCIFFTAAAVFCAFTVFDLSGFEKRVPAEDDIESVTLWNGIGGSEISGTEISDLSGSKAEFRALHEALIDEAASYDRQDLPAQNTYLTLRYKLKNGKTLERTYYFNIYALGKIRGCYEDLYNSEDYRSALLSDTSQKLAEIKKIDTLEYFGSSDDFRELPVIENHDEFLAELKKALLADLKDRTFNEALLIYPNSHEGSAVWLICYNSMADDDGSLRTSIYRIYDFDERAIDVISRYEKYLTVGNFGVSEGAS